MFIPSSAEVVRLYVIAEDSCSTASPNLGVGFFLGSAAVYIQFIVHSNGASDITALSNTLRTVKEFFKGLSRITYKRETTGPFVGLPAPICARAAS